MPCQTEGFLHISDGDCVAVPWFEFKKQKKETDLLQRAVIDEGYDMH